MPALLDFFLAGRRPAAWNQWAEVVGRDPRELRFIGDMPHGWVASDFIRSFLDLFAYERPRDRALVLAAGIPVEWLAGEVRIRAGPLRPPYLLDAAATPAPAVHCCRRPCAPGAASSSGSAAPGSNGPSDRQMRKFHFRRSS